MNTAHILIYCGLAVLIVTSAVLGWYVRQLWIGCESLSRRMDAEARAITEAQKESDILRGIVTHISERVKVLESWAASWVAFQENVARHQDARVDDVNKRLISIETENKDTPPKKREDEDPFTGSRSWAAQAASASRGLGVEDFA